MRDNKMSSQEITDFLLSKKDGVLCTVGEDGYPYGAPMNYVYLDGMFVFHGRRVGDKIGNLRREPKACFTVYDSKGFEVYGDESCDTCTIYRSVVARGDFVEITNDEEKANLLKKLVDSVIPERSGDPMPPKAVTATGVYVLKPVSITGKHHVPAAGNHILP